MVAPPRVSANLNSNTPDNEWVIICMEAPEPGVSLCSALQSFFWPWSIIFASSMMALLWNGSDLCGLNSLSLFSCWRLLYLFSERKRSENTNLMEIKSDTWNWSTIYRLYLRLLCHPAYSHFYNCVCVCVCAPFALTGMYSSSSELKADFPGWVHLWDCSVTFQP